MARQPATPRATRRSFPCRSLAPARRRKAPSPVPARGEPDRGPPPGRSLRPRRTPTALGSPSPPDSVHMWWTHAPDDTTCSASPQRKLRTYHRAMSLNTPDQLVYTDDVEANRLIAHDPMALLIGFVLDQQVPVMKAFSGPLELKRRIGSIEPRHIAELDPTALDTAFRTPPALHRFPGNMAK